MDVANQVVKTRGGLSLYTESFGEFMGKACLFIAGAGASCRFWTDAFCASLQKQGYFTIRFDGRDVGLSSAVDFVNDPYDLEDLARDLEDILDFYQIEKAHLIACSMGGFVAQWLAATAPQRVSKMVIMASGPIGEVPDYQFTLSPAQQQINAQVWSVCRSNHPSDDFDKSLDGFLQVWRMLNGSCDFDIEMATEYTRDLYVRTHHSAGFHPSYVAIIEKTISMLHVRADMLQKIQAPILVIHGKEDTLLFPQITGIPLAFGLPNAELQLIPKMGHMLFNRHLEQDLAARILSFF